MLYYIKLYLTGCLKTGKKLYTHYGARKNVKNYEGHTHEVVCMAISSDNKYLATGGKDKKIIIWSINENKFLRCFTHHKDIVSVIRHTSFLYSLFPRTPL